MSSIAGGSSLDPEQPNRPPAGALQPASSGRSSSILATTPLLPPNSPSTRYPPQYTSPGAIQSLNKPKPHHATQLLAPIFCPELPIAIPLDFASEVQHDSPPIFCPELPPVLFLDPLCDGQPDPPSDRQPDPPVNSNPDSPAIFIPDLPAMLFPEPQTADHPIFCPDLGDDRAPDFTFSTTLIGRLHKSEKAVNHRTAEESPLQEQPLPLIPANNGAADPFRTPTLFGKDGSRELSPIFTVALHDSHLLNTFGDYLPIPLCITHTNEGRNVEPCSIDGEKVLQISSSFNDKLVFVERENHHSALNPCSGPTMGTNKDHVINSTRSHWSGRWKILPLPQVAHGQTKSVTNLLLLNYQNDMNSDEMNLGWLTKELLSQRFSLPVRTDVVIMVVTLLTNV